MDYWRLFYQLWFIKSIPLMTYLKSFHERYFIFCRKPLMLLFSFSSSSIAIGQYMLFAYQKIFSLAFLSYFTCYLFSWFWDEFPLCGPDKLPICRDSLQSLQSWDYRCETSCSNQQWDLYPRHMLFGDSCQHSFILDYFLPLVPSTGRCSWLEFPSLNHLRKEKLNQLQGLLDFSGWMSYYFTLGFPGVIQNGTTSVLLDSAKSYSEAYFIVKLQEYTNWQEVWEGFSCPPLLLTMSVHGHRFPKHWNCSWSKEGGLWLFPYFH